MTPNLSDLRAALHRATVGSLRLASPDTAAIEQVIAAIRVKISERVTETPASDVIREAVGHFFQHQEVRDRRHARLTCFGCADPVLAPGYRLIEDNERFPKLLASIHAFKERARVFRPCYLGLLHAYFGYDGIEAPSPSGRGNWHRLRDFLRDSVENLVTSGMQPSWVDALDANRPLLGDDPGRFYGGSILERGYDEFERLRRTLNLRRDSWLIWRLVLGQIRAATDEADQPFLQLIPKLLDLLARTPPAANRGLAMLLDRYRERRDTSAHEGLRDYAVAQWGNPWLVANRGKWSSVGDQTREMVEGWLKRDLIRRFFNLLAADGLNDTRRFKFWERYYTSIGDMYFALGGTALRHPGIDYR